MIFILAILNFYVYATLWHLLHTSCLRASRGLVGSSYSYYITMLYVSLCYVVGPFIITLFPVLCGGAFHNNTLPLCYVVGPFIITLFAVLCGGAIHNNTLPLCYVVGPFIITLFPVLCGGAFHNNTLPCAMLWGLS